MRVETANGMAAAVVSWIVMGDGRMMNRLAVNRTVVNRIVNRTVMNRIQVIHSWMMNWTIAVIQMVQVIVSAQMI